MDRIRSQVIVGRCAAATLLLVALGCIGYAAEPTRVAAADPHAPGAADYAAHCAACHGDKLQGGVHATPLSGSVFDQNWAGKRARLLYSRIISTMPQNDPGTLTVEQAFSITLYVFSENGIAFAGHTLAGPDDLNALTIPKSGGDSK
jgi:cytochrome c